MYGFTPFSSTLNEPEEGVAPTDSRFRPDQRIMEEGDFTKANEEKVKIHEYRIAGLFRGINFRRKTFSNFREIAAFCKHACMRY